MDKNRTEDLLKKGKVEEVASKALGDSKLEWTRKSPTVFQKRDRNR
jgi:hypothetical protein